MSIVKIPVFGAQNTPIYLGGRSMAEEPNGFTRRALIIKINVPQPPTVNTPALVFGGIDISWQSVVGLYDIIIRQSTNDITYANYQTVSGHTSTTYPLRFTLNAEYGKYYKFRIRGRYINNEVSAYIDTTSIFVPLIPGTPDSLDDDDAPNMFLTAWSEITGEEVGTPTGYSLQIYLSVDSTYVLQTTITIPTNTTTYEYEVSQSGTYAFKVAAFNDIGQSSYSDFSAGNLVIYSSGT